MVVPTPPETKDRRIKVSDLKESTIELDDGAIITISPSVQFVRTVIGQQGPTGGPVYQLQISWNMTTTLPKISRKPARKVKAKDTE